MHTQFDHDGEVSVTLHAYLSVVQLLAIDYRPNSMNRLKSNEAPQD